MKTVTIIGDGAWGTALAVLLCTKGERVRMWSVFPEHLEEMKEKRENARFLPGVKLPGSLEFVPDAREALAGAGCAVCAVPTQYMRSVLGRLRGLNQGARYVSVSKGIEVGTLKRGTEIVRETLSDVRVGGLFGPSHAEEVARGLPASVVAAADDEETAREIQALFMCESLRVYTNTDLLGVELCGAVKNVVAIAAGICEGLGLGDNARAALLTRGLAEMARLGVALGAKAITFQGLAGVGDLITTCVSPYGRNRAAGLMAAEGKTLEEIKDSLAGVAEGVESTNSVLDLARRAGVEMPIAEAVKAVLYDGRPALTAVRELMTRAPKSEMRGLG